MSDEIILTPRCPVCDQPPAISGPWLATWFCGNDDCTVLSWDPKRRAGEDHRPDRRSGPVSEVVRPPIPPGPLDREPLSVHDPVVAAAMLEESLAGVELGAYDRRIVDWLKGWDQPTMVTLASIIARARR